MIDLRPAFAEALHWLDRQGIRVETVIGSLTLLIVGCGLIALTKRLLARLSLHHRFNLSFESVLIFQRLVTLILWVALGLLLLSLWGVAVSGVWTFLASAAALIGAAFIATWAMISNVTASLFISIWRPFHLGETVELIPENVTGRVIERNLMFTVIREPNGAALHVPNNLFFQKMFRVSNQYERYFFETMEEKDHRAKPVETPMEV